MFTLLKVSEGAKLRLRQAGRANTIPGSIAIWTLAIESNLKRRDRLSISMTAPTNPTEVIAC
jgi:hypothetical protein